MSAKSKIEWCDATWNPVSGCSPISEGCRHCYAREIARRFAGTKGFPNGFDVTFFPARLAIPASWKKPRKIFVCSTGDLFHKDVKDEWIFNVLETTAENDHHTYFVLTKRPERMKAFLETCMFSARVEILNHVWFGVSVENNITFHRIKTLSSIKGINRFISFEPLLEGIHNDIDLESMRKIHWIICGAETGVGARYMPYGAACGLQRLAETLKIPFFFKKWSKGCQSSFLPREFPDFGKEGE